MSRRNKSAGTAKNRHYSARRPGVANGDSAGSRRRPNRNRLSDARDQPAPDPARRGALPVPLPAGSLWRNGKTRASGRCASGARTTNEIHIAGTKTSPSTAIEASVNPTTIAMRSTIIDIGLAFNGPHLLPRTRARGAALTRGAGAGERGFARVDEPDEAQPVLVYASRNGIVGM
jgi:hypothetical protein